MRVHSPAGAATRNASAKPGNHEESLQHLGQEGEADGTARQRHPAVLRRLDGPHHEVGGRHQQQHQQRIGVVEPEHQRGHRGQRQRRAGDQARGGSAERRTAA